MTIAASGYTIPIVLTALGLLVIVAAALALGSAASGHPPAVPPAPCRSRFLGDPCTRTGPHDMHTHHERFWWDSVSEDPATEEPTS